MRFILLFVCALFLGCEQGYESRNIWGDDVAKKEIAPKEEKKAEPKMLAEIDEDIVYIWADDTKRCYYAHEFPDGDGDIVPRPFLYTDGTVADVVDFEYYRPERRFYLKVRAYEEIKENGITVGWNEVYRIFRQKKYKMEEAPKDTIFPAYEPVNIEHFEWGGLHVGKNLFGWPTIYPIDTKGGKNSSCTPEFKYFTALFANGDTLWVVGELVGVDHPQIFTVTQTYCITTRWMDYAKAVFKP